VDDFYVYEYKTMRMCSMCMSMRQCGLTMRECVFDIWILILCVFVRHCRWQYCLCDHDFDTCDNNMFFVLPHVEGNKINNIII
jgi:hypothetical protein